MSQSADSDDQLEEVGLNTETEQSRWGDSEHLETCWKFRAMSYELYSQMQIKYPLHGENFWSVVWNMHW